MGKRPAETQENESDQLKSGERPLTAHNEQEVIEYEDDFEDEFESEDDIFEAGVDGQPDEEHKIEEGRGTWIALKTMWETAVLISYFVID